MHPNQKEYCKKELARMEKARALYLGYMAEMRKLGLQDLSLAQIEDRVKQVEGMVA